MSFASKVFAIRPIEFFSNNEAKSDNKFMKEITDTDMDISMLAHNTE